MKNSYEETFEDIQADFYHYMVTYGGIAPKTSIDYVSRLKFLSKNYMLNSEITEEYIQYILEQEKTKRLERNVYTSTKSISDFKSGLRKFLSFIKSDYNNLCKNSIFEEERIINESKGLSQSEKTIIIQARIGQGSFRNNLIKYWKGCAITGFTNISLLIASHIKPWRVSNNNERIDMFNGLLLLPNYDKLFDLGYITFNTKGKLICSKFLSEYEKNILKINYNLSLSTFEEKHKNYMKYHNEYCFIG